MCERGWLICALALALARPVLLSGEDWPQFRGPTGQGHSSERGLPLEWSETTNVSWKVPVDGSGWSSPVVAGGRVWLTAVRDQTDARGRATRVSLRALAFDADTGRTVVDVEVFSIGASGPLHPKNSRASPTPGRDGDRVCVHVGADGTAALTTDGDVIWRTRLPYDSQHGNGGSPVLHDGLLIVNCDGNGGEAYVVALDAATGRTRWKTNRRPPADQAYSTPLVIRVDDRALVVSAGANRAVAYDASTGREVWWVRYDGFSNVPRPVHGAGHVFIATGFNAPTIVAVRPDGTGDVTRTHLSWTVARGAPYTPSPIVVDDLLYYVSDTGVLSSIDAASGALAWQQRIGGNYAASPVYADGRIYWLSEEGVATVIEPGRTFLQLAINRLDGATLASMAIADGAIFIRSDRHLYRIALAGR
jgi:outer membrane protein assembly factor BamB